MLLFGGCIQAQTYTLTTLPTLGGGGNAVEDINLYGQMTGTSSTYQNQFYRGFTWHTGGAIQDIGTVNNYSYSYGRAINNGGKIAGESGGNGFIWSPVTGMQAIGHLDDGNSSGALGINNSDQVVGWSHTYSGHSRAIRWTPSTGLLYLGLLGGLDSQATGINDIGNVVGWSTLSDNTRGAFYWTSGSGMTALHSLGGGLDTAYDINESGIAVGSSRALNGTTHAMLWNTNDGTWLDLGMGEAYAVNNLGQVVGTSIPNSDSANAFVWDASHGMRYLDSLISPGIRNVSATGINDVGQIVTWGNVYSQQQRHSYLLSPTIPVPEPTSLMGVLMAAGMLLKKRKKFRSKRG